jgi:hypothetical protein
MDIDTMSAYRIYDNNLPDDYLICMNSASSGSVSRAGRTQEVRDGTELKQGNRVAFSLQTIKYFNSCK